MADDRYQQISTSERFESMENTQNRFAMIGG